MPLIVIRLTKRLIRTLIVVIIGLITLTCASENNKAPDFITIGSSKEEVFAVQGTPKDIYKYSDVEVWCYHDYSRVKFRNGKLDEWSNNGSLRVSLVPSKANNKPARNGVQQPINQHEQPTFPQQGKNLEKTYKQATFARKKQAKAYSSSAGTAENGSYYGQISPRTGQPKTTRVQGYYRKDGTYVRGHYRSRR